METSFRNKFDEIFNSCSLTRAEKLRLELALIRRQYIYVRNSYAFGMDKGTIDPDNANVKTELESGDVEGERPDEFTKIFANSFGPFDPEFFFRDDTLRIVFLLKEPYLCDLAEMRGRVEGIAQDVDYSTWAAACEVSTYEKLIKYSQVLLQAFKKGGIDKISDERLKRCVQALPSEEDLNDENVVMRYICIIQANNFPALALSDEKRAEVKNGGNTLSDDKLIGKWAQQNKDYIGMMLEVASPLVVVGASTLQHFCGTYFDGNFQLPGDRYAKTLLALSEANALYLVFGERERIRVDFVESLKAYILRSIGEAFGCEATTYFIDAYHPAAPSFLPEDAKTHAGIIHPGVKEKIE